MCRIARSFFFSVLRGGGYGGLCGLMTGYFRGEAADRY